MKKEKKVNPPKKAEPAAKKERESIYGGRAVRHIPEVFTVGDLKEMLRLCPDDLPLPQDGYKPVWFNVGQEDEHLSLEQNDGTWDEELAP